jgi:hypothetical protein
MQKNAAWVILSVKGSRHSPTALFLEYFLMVVWVPAFAGMTVERDADGVIVLRAARSRGAWYFGLTRRLSAASRLQGLQGCGDALQGVGVGQRRAAVGGRLDGELAALFHGVEKL